jgi:hypothetical protein
MIINFIKISTLRLKKTFEGNSLFIEPCGGDIDLELMGGVVEIRLRTEVKNGVEFYR